MAVNCHTQVLLCIINNISQPVKSLFALNGFFCCTVPLSLVNALLFAKPNFPTIRYFTYLVMYVQFHVCLLCLFVGIRREICDHQANAVYCIARVFAPVWKLVSAALDIPHHVISNIYDTDKNNPIAICEKLIKYWFETRSEANIHVLLHILDEPYLKDELKDKITLIQANLSGMAVKYPDIFPRPVADNYTQMIVQVIKILEKFPNAHEELLLYLRYYPDKVKVNNHLFEKTKNVREIVDTLVDEGLLSPINVNKLYFLVESINCIEAKKEIERYELSIQDKPIADELMWCLGQCQSPEKCFVYARWIGDPKIVTYRDLQRAKAGMSMYMGIPVHNMVDDVKGKGSVIVFWRITEEDAQKLHLSKVVPLPLKETLLSANITEIGICFKEKQESIFVDQLSVATSSEGTYVHNYVHDYLCTRIKG